MGRLPLLPTTGCYSSEDEDADEDEDEDGVLDDVLSLALLSVFGLSVEADAGLASSSLLEELEPPDLPELRLSVTYQPLPLKMTPTGCSTRRIGPCPHSMHSVSESAVTGCIFSNRCPQFLQAYS